AWPPLAPPSQSRARGGSHTLTVTRIVAPSMRHTTREPRPSSGDGPPSKRTLLLALNHVGQRSARQSHFHATSGGAATSCSLATNTGQLAGSRPGGQRGHPARGTARSRRRRIGRHAPVALGPDVARGPAGRHGDAVALLLGEAQHHLHR